MTRKFSLHKLGIEAVTADFPARFSLGELDVKCHFCGALSFATETLPKRQYEACPSFPAELKKLYLEDRLQQKNIRTFDNLVAFASTKMTPAKDLPVKKFGSGVIRISGQI